MIIKRHTPINGKGEKTGPDEYEFERDEFLERFRIHVGESYVIDNMPLPKGYIPVGVLHFITGMAEQGFTFWIWYLWPFARIMDFIYYYLWHGIGRFAYKHGLIAIWQVDKHIAEGRKLTWFWPRYLKAFNKQDDEDKTK